MTHKPIKISPRLVRSVEISKVGVIDGGRILRFACKKPIKGEKLKKILSKYPKLIARASFDQWEPHPPKTRPITFDPISHSILQGIVEEYDSTWKPKLWEWHDKSILIDDQEYSLLHLEVHEVLHGNQKGALRKDGLKQREDLIRRLKKHGLSPTHVPKHKRK